MRTINELLELVDEVDPTPLSGHTSTTRGSLKITGDTNETYVRLAENEQAILEAFADVINGEASDKPRYVILKFEMGTGKNEAYLSNLATSKKKGILVSENHLQVNQNVNTATHKFGLRSLGFRGRGHHFNDSGLAAIPLKLRQQRPAFFETHDVVCLFYDQIEIWGKKGLAANAYCQSCPLRPECPYLEQFTGLSQVDFLAISSPDLFFDPTLWNFLYRLTKRETETTEEEVIGAAFGLEKETEAYFDVGVVDEATATNLYQDYEYPVSIFEKLAHAWEGEPLGDFLTGVLSSLNTQDPQSEVQTLIDTFDKDTQKQISEQMTRIPIPVNIIPHLLQSRETDEILSEFYAKRVGAAEDDYENEWHIPVSKEAEQILREKKAPTIPYQHNMPNRKIGLSPYTELRKGTIRISDIAGRIWASEWTLFHQLKNAIRIEIQKIGTKYTQKGEEINCDIVTLTTPPQVNPYINNIVFMGGHAETENIIKAFGNANIEWIEREGKRAEYATGVQTSQLLDSRLTYASIFDFEKDTEGKKVYDDETNSPNIIGFTQLGKTLLTHLCTLSEQHIAAGNPKPIFISWYEFTVAPIADTELGKRMHACLEIGHYDNMKGLNYDGHSKYIVFGYPKARPDVIKQKAEILHHDDTEPLDETYDTFDEIADGFETIGQRRYLDARMETQRQREIRDKAEQAVYRSRPTRWTNTQTLYFSSEPLDGWTQRATGFMIVDFRRSKTFEDLAARVAEREALTAENTIQDFQRSHDCSYRHARRLWEKAGGKDLKEDAEAKLIKQIQEMINADPKMSNHAIAKTLNILESKVRRVRGSK